MTALRRAKALLAALRTRSRRVDHVMRTVAHFGEVQGGQLAGAVTYFGFLSFFPLLAVAFAVLARVVAVDPSARTKVEKLLVENLPGIVGRGSGQIDVSTLSSTSTGVGILGLVGLLYAGLGWLDALREALRNIFCLGRSAGNVVVRKLSDVVILAAVGTAVLVTVSISTLATSATTQVLGWVGLDDAAWAILGLKVLALLLSVAADALVLTLIFARLPGPRGEGQALPWRAVVSGAVLGAVLLEVLKVAGAWLVARTTNNPVYGAFALAVGLLVWLNFVCRAILYAAAWAATAPGAPSVVAGESPGGSGAQPDADRAAGTSRRGPVAALLGVAVLVGVRRSRPGR